MIFVINIERKETSYSIQQGCHIDSMRITIGISSYEEIKFFSIAMRTYDSTCKYLINYRLPRVYYPSLKSGYKKKTSQR